MPKEFRSLISLQEAKSIISDHLPTAREDAVSLGSSLGCILAEKVISSQDVPGFGRASRDGYAVISPDTIVAREDRPVSLRLAGSVPMGRRPEIEISRGEAAEVSTGSMMPKGADAVVMIEYSLAQKGIVPKLEGQGLVVNKQSPAPGAPWPGDKPSEFVLWLSRPS